MNNLVYWIAGLATAGLFVNLLVALWRAEDL